LNQIGIVVSNYNSSITENLLRGALTTLASAGIAEGDVEVARVPGAWEVPLAASWLVRRPGIRGVICLAAVIRGETSHDQHINRAVSTALMEIGLRSDLPVLFGVLTCNTVEQAIHRSGGDFGNKGAECASAALEMIALKEKLRMGDA
jgi:6,7-dimethyl-8-ribityllumazine synthase